MSLILIQNHPNQGWMHDPSKCSCCCTFAASKWRNGHDKLRPFRKWFIWRWCSNVAVHYYTTHNILWWWCEYIIYIRSTTIIYYEWKPIASEPSATQMHGFGKASPQQNSEALSFQGLSPRPCKVGVIQSHACCSGHHSWRLSNRKNVDIAAARLPDQQDILLAAPAGKSQASHPQHGHSWFHILRLWRSWRTFIPTSCGQQSHRHCMEARVLFEYCLGQESTSTKWTWWRCFKICWTQTRKNEAAQFGRRIWASGSSADKEVTAQKRKVEPPKESCYGQHFFRFQLEFQHRRQWFFLTCTVFVSARKMQLKAQLFDSTWASFNTYVIGGIT